MPAALPVDWNAIRIACVSGRFTLREAAEVFGVAFNTIGARSAREEWYPKDQTVAANRLAEDAPLVAKRANAMQTSEQMGQNVAVTVAGTLADDKRRTKAAMAKIARKTTEHVADLEPDAAFGKAKALASLGQAYKSFVGDDPTAGNLMLQLNFFSGNRENGEPAAMEAEVLES